MSTIYDEPSWLEAVCAGIEAADAIRKEIRERSHLIKKAHDAWVHDGDAAAAAAALAKVREFDESRHPRDLGKAYNAADHNALLRQARLCG
jgi:hypothetical protein